jgi:hypothetical protein
LAATLNNFKAYNTLLSMGEKLIFVNDKNAKNGI